MTKAKVEQKVVTVAKKKIVDSKTSLQNIALKLAFARCKRTTA